MIKNPSTNEKTIKSELIASIRNKWHVDRFIKYSNYDGLVFVPDLSLLDLYRDYFEQHLIEYEIDEKYYYSPSYFAKEYYGDSEMDFIVMYFAKMTSMFEFNRDRIMLLPVEFLQDINKLAIKYEDEINKSRSKPDKFMARGVSYIGTKEYK